MSPGTVIWLDGIPASNLPLPDRGLDFGDGLFETLLLQQGEPLFSDLHLERLQRGLNALAMPDCVGVTQEHIHGAAEFVKQQNWSWAVLRISLLRGVGERGYAGDKDAIPRILVVATKLDRDCRQLPAAAKLSLATIRFSFQPLLAGIKHLNRLEQVLAATQAKREGNDESLMLDQTERLTSVSSGNLFLLRHGELLTPELQHCGIAGTRRQLVVDKWGPALGLKVREATLTLQDLEEAEEVFYSNSLVALRPICSMLNYTWESQKVCREIFNQYLEDLK